MHDVLDENLSGLDEFSDEDYFSDYDGPCDDFTLEKEAYDILKE